MDVYTANMLNPNHPEYMPIEPRKIHEVTPEQQDIIDAGKLFEDDWNDWFMDTNKKNRIRAAK